MLQMVYCAVCCEPYHGFCLSSPPPASAMSSVDWCCPRCQCCHVCGRQDHVSHADFILVFVVEVTGSKDLICRRLYFFSVVPCSLYKEKGNHQLFTNMAVHVSGKHVYSDLQSCTCFLSDTRHRKCLAHMFHNLGIKCLGTFFKCS